MNTTKRKLLTIITEAIIERRVVEDIKRLGAHGYTIVEARGEGSHGLRSAEGEQSRNLRIEAVCEEHTADGIAEYLFNHYSKNYAMVIYLSEVEVLRPEKF